MARTKDYNYFDGFITMAEHSCSAAAMLERCIENYNPDTLSQQLVEMHHIEHSADLIKHELLENLAKEFIAPIEREDIITLSQEIDNVTDAVEDVLVRMYMFHIRQPRAEAAEFTGLIVRCCDAIKKMMEEFKHFRRSNSIKEYVVEVNRLEEVGDQLYTQAMYSVFTPGTDPMEAAAWSQIFDHLERCCDACEDVADVVESVIMKNT